MELYEAIRKRKSVRRYKKDRVPDDALFRILEAGRLAPSWCNRQCWRYIVVDDPSAIEKMVPRAASAFGAPMYIVLCADPEQSGKKEGKDYYLVDAAISMEHVLLAATAEGLGTCWIGGMFDEKEAKDALGIPDGIRVVAMTPLGYESESVGGTINKVLKPILSAQTRKPLKEITFKNKYGEPLS